MIALHDVSDVATKHGKSYPVLSDVSFAFDRRRMGIMAAVDEEGEALIDLISGMRLPMMGSIQRRGRVSWPIGRLLQFRSELSGRDTLRFVCDLYGCHFRQAEDLILSLVDPGRHYSARIAEWPRLLNVKFGHALALLPEFDIYVVEGALELADAAFMQAWMPLFEERVGERQLIMACQYAVYLSRQCRSTVALVEGKLIACASVEQASELCSRYLSGEGPSRPPEVEDDFTTDSALDL